MTYPSTSATRAQTTSWPAVVVPSASTRSRVTGPPPRLRHPGGRPRLRQPGPRLFRPDQFCTNWNMYQMVGCGLVRGKPETACWPPQWTTPRRRHRRSQPAPAGGGHRHQPPHAHLPLRFPGGAAGGRDRGGRGSGNGKMCSGRGRTSRPRHEWNRLQQPGPVARSASSSSRLLCARGPPGTAGFLEGIVESWVGPMADAMVEAGTDRSTARADARLGVAVVRACSSTCWLPANAGRSTRRSSAICN